jgi:Carboxypeptidase regulatory-like domain
MIPLAFGLLAKAYNPRMATKLHMPAPCPSKWNEMTGDERVRHCSGCNRNVYNFSAMTESDIDELLAHHQGQLCVRTQRRARDGEISKQAVLAKPLAGGQRGAGVAGAALVSLMGLFSPLAVQTTAATMATPRQVESIAESVIVWVSDESGLPVSRAKVTIVSPSTGDSATGETDEHGGFHVRGLAPGVYDLTVINPVFPEFRPFHKSDLVLPSKEPVLVHLQVHFIGSLNVTVTQADPAGQTQTVSSPMGELAPERQSRIGRFLSKLHHLF